AVATTTVVGLIVTVVPAFAFALLVPASTVGIGAPLAELLSHLAGPAWVRVAGGFALLASAVLLLLPVLDAALAGAEPPLRRLSARRLLPHSLPPLHPRLRTPPP